MSAFATLANITNLAAANMVFKAKSIDGGVASFREESIYTPDVGQPTVTFSRKSPKAGSKMVRYRLQYKRPILNSTTGQVLRNIYINFDVAFDEGTTEAERFDAMKVAASCLWPDTATTGNIIAASIKSAEGMW